LYSVFYHKPKTRIPFQIRQCLFLILKVLHCINLLSFRFAHKFKEEYCFLLIFRSLFLDFRGHKINILKYFSYLKIAQELHFFFIEIDDSVAHTFEGL
jgi:hypothetical protein